MAYKLNWIFLWYFSKKYWTREL